MAITFAIVDFARIPSCSALGLFDGLNRSLAAGLAAAGVLGAIPGRWTAGVPEPVQMRIAEVLLLVLSLMLVSKAALGSAGAGPIVVTSLRPRQKFRCNRCFLPRKR